jgi:CTP synthase (UTP-ammonia lyase)
MGDNLGVKRVAILGDFSPVNGRHLATNAAIQHSSAALGIRMEGEWIATDAMNPSVFERFEGIWIAPGSPYRNMTRVLWAIQYAREQGIPCLGTCGGFQHMVIEYARNVLNIQEAQHAEYEPYASDLFISQLQCSLAGREMRLIFAPGSRVASAYGAFGATEEYYCNFGVNPEKVDLLRSGPLQVTGSDSEGEVRVVELPSHPFFVGTLFVPQTRSTASRPHPLVNAFLSAVNAISDQRAEHAQQRSH